MPRSLIFSFILYAFVSAITPGPANIALFAAAVRYGKKPALRQWQGNLAGFSVIVLTSVVITWILGTALNRYVGYFAWVGAVYILWLAWNIFRSGDLSAEHDPSEPTFRTGFLLQMTNLKVMVICLTVLAGYVLPYSQSFGALLECGAILLFTGSSSNLVWLAAGGALQKFYAAHRRMVDIVMAVLLALCALSLIVQR